MHTAPKITCKLLQPLLLEAGNCPVVCRQARIVLCSIPIGEEDFDCPMKQACTQHVSQYESLWQAHQNIASEGLARHPPPNRLSMKALALCLCLYSTKRVELRCKRPVPSRH